MELQQAAIEQPEVVKSYDEQMQEDTRAAFAEVTSKASPEPVADKPAPIERTSEPRTAAERARDEQGRFAKTEDKPIEKVAPQQPLANVPAAAKEASRPVPVSPLTAQAAGTTPAVRPPDDWDVKAKAQWDRLPAVVREAIGKSTAADPAIAEIKPFLDQAKQNGQSLASALQSYVGMENYIKRDPAGGLLHVAQNLGLTQHQAGRLFADLATRLGVMPQSNGQQQMLPQDGHDAQQGLDPYQALAPVLNPFQERLNTLETVIRQQQEALQGQRLGASMSAVEKFRSSPEAKYFSNVEREVTTLLERGIVPRTGDYLADLKAAYDTACRMHPEISEILIQEKAEAVRAKAEADARQAADKARQASRSVAGSPPSGTLQSARKPNGMSYDQDLTNDVMDAIRQVSGRA